MTNDDSSNNNNRNNSNDNNNNNEKNKKRKLSFTIEATTTTTTKEKEDVTTITTTTTTTTDSKEENNKFIHNHNDNDISKAEETIIMTDPKNEESNSQQPQSSSSTPSSPPIPVDRYWIQKLLQQYPNPNSYRTDGKALVVAPMVDQSDKPFRILCRNYGANLCFTPMIHSRLLLESASYQTKFFSTNFDRPIIAQLCGSDPDIVLRAAQMLEPYVDGIDINCGCPQGIAKRGNYGAYLLEQEETLLTLVKHLVQYLKVPLSVKVRLLPKPEEKSEYHTKLRTATSTTTTKNSSTTKSTSMDEKQNDDNNNDNTSDEVEEFDIPKASLALYQKLVDAGIHLLTIHGRTRKQKGPDTGHSDWKTIRKAVDMFQDRIPIFANGSIQDYNDVEECFRITNADGVMSSESILEYPPLFYKIPQHGKTTMVVTPTTTSTSPLDDNNNNNNNDTTTSTNISTSNIIQRTIGRVQLAEEYLQLAKVYPPNQGGQGSGLKCMRIHLHRFLHADLQSDPALRTLLVRTKTIPALYEALENCKRWHEQHHHVIETETLSWYTRHRNNENGNGNNGGGEGKYNEDEDDDDDDNNNNENDEEQVKEQHEKEEAALECNTCLFGNSNNDASDY